MIAPRDEKPNRSTWRGYKGMSPTIALLGIGTVFVLLAALMLVRGGHDDASAPTTQLNRETVRPQ